MLIWKLELAVNEIDLVASYCETCLDLRIEVDEMYVYIQMLI